MATNIDVIVVGGGIAGVTAARDLADAGLSVGLLEARDRLGGRTYYRQLSGTDRKVEFGGTWIDPVMYRCTAQEIARYDLPLTQSPEPERYISILNGRISEAPFPIPSDQWLALEKGIYRIIKDMHRIDSSRAFDEQDLGDLDVPASAYLRRLDLPPESTDYVGAWTRLTSGAPLEDVSMLMVLAFCAGLGNSALSAVTILSTKFANGTISLVEAMLAGGDVDVYLDTPVVQITQQRGAATAVTRDGREFAARALVLAIPVNCWSDVVFTPALSRAKQQLGSQGHAGIARKLWVKVKGAGGSVLALNAVGDRLDLCIPEYTDQDGDWLATFSTAREDFDVGRLDAVDAAMKLFDQRLEVVEVDYHDWIADPYAKGTWMAHRPGWLSEHHSEMRRREDRIVFAGADVATRMPASIEAAVETGCEAAAEVRTLLDG